MKKLPVILSAISLIVCLFLLGDKYINKSKIAYIEINQILEKYEGMKDE